VYASLRNRPKLASETRTVRTGRIGRNVILLGLVSLFTDLSQEMVVAVLPLYLTVELGLSVFAFGIIDGLYGGATAFVRIFGALVADRRRQYKEVAGIGYGASAACKLGLFAAGGAWLPTTAFLLVDRLGKGVRTAPRDALISLSSDRAVLGRAFGVHRALDTVGALLGPLAAFVLLSAVPGAYDAIFLTSFCIALVGLAILVLFVQNREPSRADDEPPTRVSLRAALGLLRRSHFRTITIVGGVLSLLTVSDAFIYLSLQRDSDLDVRLFPLLFLGTALVYLILAIPFGRLADRFGRGRVYVAGHLSLLAVYALLLVAQVGAPEVVLCLALLGTYYAATDGVLMALASEALPETLRTSGLALVTTATATARFGSSLLFGALWATLGPTGAASVFLVALVVALVPAGLALNARGQVAT
jgi:MFS family permease